MKCHTCHDFAHMTFQCPSKSVAMAEKGSSKISPKSSEESKQADLEDVVTP
jgi:hypothetical protein